MNNELSCQKEPSRLTLEDEQEPRFRKYEFSEFPEQQLKVAEPTTPYGGKKE